MASTDGNEGALTGTRQHRAGSAGEGEHLLGALGALLTECERLRTMGDVAARRLRRTIGDLEGRINGGEETSGSPSTGSCPPASERPNPPSFSLQRIRLEKSMTKGSPQPVVRHGLVVGSVVAFAALWALGIVVDLPQRPVSVPSQFHHETREIRELNRAPAAQAPMNQERQPRPTGQAVAPAAPPAPGTIPPGGALPPLSTGFVGRALTSPSGHARASNEAMRPRVETDLELQSSAVRPGLTRPTDTVPRRGPSPETP